MVKKYNYKVTEKKWQERWLKQGIYEPGLKSLSAKGRKPFYNLMMFPYPSAEGLHVGNMYAFTGSDVYGRFKRMQGYDVFEPIGLDGFGIHSENYALKVGTHPAKQTKISEKNFYRQLKEIGNGFAWKEKVETYDPEYYRWTQWIFAEMFKRGLAYRKKQAVNWCPSCKTVLADEQVISGKCERCSTEVIKKDLEQWFFRITKYADRLLKDLEKLDWSERIKIAQRNWIGKSEGAEVEFRIKNKESGIKDTGVVKVFTTRPETIFGATYLALSPEHDLVSSTKYQVSNWKEVEDYIKKAKAKSDDPPSHKATEGQGEKTGVELKGVRAINPATKKEIPIWVTDYVLAGYGTGAIMAVPAHDERDFEFATKYKLPIYDVIEPVYIQDTEPGIVKEGLPFEHRDAVIVIVKHWSEDKYIGLKWKKVAWGTFITGGIEKGQTPEEAAKTEIREETGYLNPKFVDDFGIVHGKFYHVPKKVNRFAHSHVVYLELQDGAREDISEKEREIHDVLWLTLPELEKFLTPGSHHHALRMLKKTQRAYEELGILRNSGDFDGMDSEESKWKVTEFVGGKRKIQYRLRDWLISRQRYWGPPIPMIFCEKCAENKKGEQKEMPGWYAVPEKDLPVVLPPVKDFRPRGKGQSPLASVKFFYEVKCPACKSLARRETDISDNFLDSAWYYLRYIDSKNKKELFSKKLAEKWLPINMYIGGAEHSVLHLLYVRFLAKVFYDWGLVRFDEPAKKFRAHGLLIRDGKKISKSKGNIINPDDFIKEFGADALRMHLMFLGPFEDGGDFRDSGILGLSRFLDRVFKLVASDNFRKSGNLDFERILHKTIKKVTEDIENLHYNTAISALMILLNEAEKSDGISKEQAASFLKLLAPFAPYLSEELYQQFFGSKLGVRSSKRFDSIHLSEWPKYDSNLIKENTFNLVVQVNGKTRDAFEVSTNIKEAEAKSLALNRERVQKFTEGKEIKKTIFVAGRLINLVI
ncbi:MAG: class I tRNA ligase family protein [Candidatus Paceibacterota bacterium]